MTNAARHAPAPYRGADRQTASRLYVPGRQRVRAPQARGDADSSQRLRFQAMVPCDSKYVLAAGRRAVPRLQPIDTISAPNGSGHGHLKLGSALSSQPSQERQLVKVLLAEDIALIR